MRIVKYASAGLSTLLLLSGCTAQVSQPAHNTLTSQERAAGWELLFDGASFKSWRGLGRDRMPDGYWVIEDGLMKKPARKDVERQADGQPLEAGDILTVDQYENFEFVIEWRISPGGNSGIKYNVSEELSTSIGGKHSALGFEYQVIDHQGYKGELKDTQKAGALYDLIPAENVALRPIDEFNETRILFQGNHIAHWLNGQKILECELGPQLDELIAQSKFHNIPDFGKKKKGHIVLQDHADAVWYRNIKIRALPAK